MKIGRCCGGPWTFSEVCRVSCRGLTLLLYLLGFTRLARDYDYQRSTFTISPLLFSELYSLRRSIPCIKSSISTSVVSAAESSEGDR